MPNPIIVSYYGDMVTTNMTNLSAVSPSCLTIVEQCNLYTQDVMTAGLVIGVIVGGIAVLLAVWWYNDHYA